MHLSGIHHITAITGDGQRNVDFYVRVLGLRLVKKTVNFDAPDLYHLYFGDELGHPGSIMTFFEYPGAAPGTAGAGMIHRVIWRVASEEAIEFWSDRLEAEGVPHEITAGSLMFSDPEELDLQLSVVETHDKPLAPEAPDVPAEHALLGFEGVRAYTGDEQATHDLLVEVLGFTPLADGVGFRLRGGAREALYHCDSPPDAHPIQGAGTVHHIAWASADDEIADWRERVRQAAAGRADGPARVGSPTEIIDRQYFRSIYFREPSGVLFEIATISPGFTVDEAPGELGESLKLPLQHEHVRPKLEQTLTPLLNPRITPVDT